MTTEDTNRLPEIIKYLEANPTPPPAQPGGQHIHIHHHYAPPAPPVPPPRATFMDQLPAYLLLLTAMTIIGTICAAILAVIGVVVIAVLVVAAVVIALLAYLVRSMGESQALRSLAQEQGRKTSARTRSRRPH